MLRENSAKEIEELLKKAPAAVSAPAYTGVSASDRFAAPESNKAGKSIDEIKSRLRLRFRFRLIDSVNT